MNESRTCLNFDTPVTQGRSRPVPIPARYEIICPDGTTTGNFASAREAAFSGEATWPDQELGEGWDIQRRVQVVGS